MKIYRLVQALWLVSLENYVFQLYHDRFNYTVKQCILRVLAWEHFLVDLLWRYTIKKESSVYKKQLIFSQQSSPIFFFS